MSELHDILWTHCRKLPTDFQPYGERDRDTVDPCADCSCGCRHFLALAGGLGNDWGVCANPKSPRVGLLTFEHQGCPHFEPDVDESTETAETETSMIEDAAPRNTDEPEIGQPLKKLKIDFEEFIIALEGWGSDSMRYYLDTETGEIAPLSEDEDDYHEWREKIDAAEFGCFIEIERLEPHQSFEVMEKFAHSLPESRDRRDLIDALSRNKPFRRFKDAAHRDIELRDRWFAFRDRSYAALAHDWLEGKGIHAEWIDPRNTAQQP